MLTEHTEFAVMILFFIIYGVTGAVPLIAALYLLRRRGNAFAPESPAGAESFQDFA